MSKTLQWGGRFAAEPDAALLAFGSSLNDDLVLAPFDVECSRAHVAALTGGRIIDAATSAALDAALVQVGHEVADGSFVAFARAGGFEDVHGAVDARVRELAGEPGAFLHSGRSRNDQVATDLALYARDRAARGAARALEIASLCAERAELALHEGTLLAATTHWQPAQPVLLGFWLDAAAQGFVRAARRFLSVRDDARRFCPLGSAALAGSSLPLDRDAAAAFLGFAAPTTNALDTVGDRDVALDLLNAVARAALAASRLSEEFVIWATPAFGYARLDDAASTGSSLMPQKRNPDPFELVRAAASRVIAAYAGALATTTGVALSYHRDLQETKALVLAGTERGLAALDAFGRAFAHLAFDTEAMIGRAGDGFTVATDLADALIASGRSARDAHHAVGERVVAAEIDGRPLDARDAAALGVPDAPTGPAGSVAGKRTAGSTNPAQTAAAIATTRRTLADLLRELER